MAQAQVALDWQARINTILGQEAEFAKAAVVDADGNVYVTGSNYAGTSSLDYAVNTDFITVKYDAVGNLKWIRRYNGPAGSLDEAAAIALDAKGNVYVTGKSASRSNGTDYDYATVKYSTTGDLQWVRRYNGPSNRDDEATTICVDAAGNILVAGKSYRDNKSTDLITVKYTAAGLELWTSTFSRGNNEHDRAVAIAADVQGNVVVAGVNENKSSGYDFATIKLDDKGQQIWARYYNGLANGADELRSLSLDPMGNVLVAGYSATLVGQDLITIKYAADGSQVWLRTYNGMANNQGKDQASKVMTDATGNVYVTGTSTGNTGQDFITIRYDAYGSQVWSKTFNSPIIGADLATSLALDPMGNVLVTGISTSATEQDFTTIKYGADGSQLWSKTYQGAAVGGHRPVKVGADKSGNVYLAGYSHGGSSQEDYTILKYSPQGEDLWLQRYIDATNLSEVATAQVLDADGNVFITGYASGGRNGDDLVTAKYDATGKQLWIRFFDGYAHGDDQARALKIDAAGNVYVAGYSTGVYGRDYATLKYDTHGNLLWVQTFNGTGRGDDQARGLTLDASGFVYVTGNSYGVNSDGDYATIKYDPNGTLLWVANYKGLGKAYDQANAVATDAQGFVYVTGSAVDIKGFENFVTLKYDGAGILLWEKHYDGPAGQHDQPTALALDAGGNVLVTGTSTGSGSKNFALLKYDGAGNLLWEKHYDGPAGQEDQPTALALDAGGQVYVTGYSLSPTGQDYATLKYDGAGNLLWEQRYNGPANGPDKPAALALDAEGNLYVSGYSAGASGQDIATIKYNGQGQQLWIKIYNGPANGADQALGLAVDANNKVYVAGGSIGSGASLQDMLLMRYRQFTATTWTGLVSEDWHQDGNWDNEAPTELVDAIVPGQTVREPWLSSGSSRVKKLHLNGGKINLAGGLLEVYGDYTNTGGILEATGGTFSFNGVAGQTASLSEGGRNRFYHLTVGTNGLQLNGPAAVGGILALNGNLQTNGHQLLLVSDALSTAMVVNNGGEVLGYATMQRSIFPQNPGYGYRHYASPVSNTTVADLETSEFEPIINPVYNNQPRPVLHGDDFPNVQGYDESRLTASYPYFNDGWNSPQSLSDPLLPGRGYSVNLPGTAVVDLVGTLNNGTITVPVTRGPVSSSGWNFLGNPYPAPIAWDNLVLPDGVDNAVYVFRSSGKYSGSYASYVNGVGTLPGGIIPAMQSFMVRATKNTTFTFTNAARLSTYANPAFYRMQSEQRPLVKLELQAAADTLVDETIIYFDAAAGKDTDETFDAYKIQAPGLARPAIYSLSGTDQLAINALPPVSEPVVLPLGLAGMQAGSHTLQATQLVNFGPGLSVVLEDRKTGKWVDLKQQPAYAFTTSGNEADRFYLHFNKQEAEAGAAARLLVYPNPVHKEDIRIRLFGLEGKVLQARLINSLGRQVLESRFEISAGSVQTQIPAAHLPAGIYYLQLTDGKLVTRKKIVVQ